MRGSSNGYLLSATSESSGARVRRLAWLRRSISRLLLLLPHHLFQVLDNMITIGADHVSNFLVRDLID